MNAAKTILLVLIGASFVFLNVKATLAIGRDFYPEPAQRMLQLLLVWLLPMIGAILVLAVHRADEKPSRQYREAMEVEDRGFGNLEINADSMSVDASSD